jgi:drug/metabolite transporter (DMT)-like permease
VGTFWLQARFQRDTTSQRVALIFALEPVFATGFAWWLLGETLGWTGAAGAMLVLAAVVGAELWSSRRQT